MKVLRMAALFLLKSMIARKMRPSAHRRGKFERTKYRYWMPLYMKIIVSIPSFAVD